MNNILLQAKNTPGRITESELKILFDLVTPYNNANAIGVEIGSYMGRSAIALAEGISQGQLYCFDPFKIIFSMDQILDITYITDNEKELFLPFDKQCIFDIFKENTKNISNITPIRCDSHENLNFDFDIDFFFLDAAHTNPSDINWINFFLPKVKKGGLIIGHDFHHSFKDVIENINYLEKHLNKSVRTYSKTTLWSFQLD